MSRRYWVVDAIEPDHGDEHIRVFDREKDAETFAASCKRLGWAVTQWEL